MPKQAPLRLIKRCRLYCPKHTCMTDGYIPSTTRGVYVLYKDKSRGKKKKFEVFYIGVGGIAKDATSGVGRRIRNHRENKQRWTHYSLFEVHDNVSREEILEIEQLFLRMFRHDNRIKLDNIQHGSAVFKRLSRKSQWPGKLDTISVGKGGE
jgi:hypothetical protein